MKFKVLTIFLKNAGVFIGKVGVLYSFSVSFAYPTYEKIMSNYRRNRVPGETYFFTVNLLERHSQSCLLVNHVDVLREAVRVTKCHALFHIDAWVVLPEHMHSTWTDICTSVIAPA